MAAGQIKVTDDAPKLVTCGECRRYERDTEGRSYNRETGEFFLGLCGEGLHPDTPVKQFANKPRVCEKFLAK